MAPQPKHSYPLGAYQPFKLFAVLWHVCGILGRLPYWLLISAVPQLRPDPRWTFLQTLMGPIIFRSLDLLSAIAYKHPNRPEPTKDTGNTFRLVQPFPDELYQGPLRHNELFDVQPRPVPCTWYPSQPPTPLPTHTSNGEATKIALVIHGGAFLYGDSAPEFCTFMNESTSALGCSHALFVAYRLSNYGGFNPFPAAFQDTLTAYLYLVRTLSIPTEHIVLVGDSAGANLVLALLRYIEAYPGLDIPRPICKAAVLFSPWVAPLDALPAVTYRKHPNWSRDYVPETYIRWGARAYIQGVDLDVEAKGNSNNEGGGDGTKMEAYIQPKGYPFRTSVPLFITTAENEVLKDGIEYLAREMGQVPGNEVVLREMEAQTHDLFPFGHVMGWSDGFLAECRGIRRWLDRDDA